MKPSNPSSSQNPSRNGRQISQTIGNATSARMASGQQNNISRQKRKSAISVFMVFEMSALYLLIETPSPFLSTVIRCALLIMVSSASSDQP